MEPLALLTAAVALVGAEVAKRCGGLLVDQTFAGLKAFLKGRLGREPQPDDLTPATLGVAQAGASPAFVEQARAVVARSSALRRAQLVRSAPFVGRPRMVRASAGRRYGPPIRGAGGERLLTGYPIRKVEGLAPRRRCSTINPAGPRQRAGAAPPSFNHAIHDRGPGSRGSGTSFRFLSVEGPSVIRFACPRCHNPAKKQM